MKPFRCNPGFPLVVLLASFPLLALVIDPLAVKVAEQPGGEATGSISVTNEKNDAVIVQLQVTDISKPSTEVKNWLNLDTSEFNLAPGEVKPVQYRISIPKTAVGQLAARLGFQEASDAGAGSAVGVRTRVSIYIVAIARGTEIYDAEITSIRLHPENSRIIETSIMNTGNVYIKPSYHYRIFHKAKGNEALECSVTDPKRALFPGRKTKVAGRLPSPLEAGQYVVELSLQLSDANDVISKRIDFSVSE